MVLPSAGTSAPCSGGGHHGTSRGGSPPHPSKEHGRPGPDRRHPVSRRATLLEAVRPGGRGRQAVGPAPPRAPDPHPPPAGLPPPKTMTTLTPRDAPASPSAPPP